MSNPRSTNLLAPLLFFNVCLEQGPSTAQKLLRVASGSAHVHNLLLLGNSYSLISVYMGLSVFLVRSDFLTSCDAFLQLAQFHALLPGVKYVAVRITQTSMGSNVLNEESCWWWFELSFTLPSAGKVHAIFLLLGNVVRISRQIRFFDQNVRLQKVLDSAVEGNAWGALVPAAGLKEAHLSAQICMSKAVHQHKVLHGWHLKPLLYQAFNFFKAVRVP